MSRRRITSLLVTAAVAALSLAATAQWQIACALGPISSPFDPLQSQAPTPYAASELQTIYQLLCPAGCGRVDLYSNATAPNALTITAGAGMSVIAYNPGFMNQVYTQIGPGATFGILAHEFGHHVDLNTTPPWMNNAWSRELKADAWSGCALARVGLSSAQMAAALQAISVYPSPSHPAWNLRIPALQRGYAACGGNSGAVPWGG